MNDLTLAESVLSFAQITQSIPDNDLDRPWGWMDYDSDGVRFAFFRTFEDLRSLAVKIAESRRLMGQPPTEAHQVLGNYHAAYRDLQAVLIQGNEKTFNQPPAEREWPIRRAFAHIVGADMGFYVVIRYALERHRSANAGPAKIPAGTRELFLGLSEEAEDRLLDAPVAALAAHHEAFHARVLQEFAGITTEELELPSHFWEDEAYHLRFRLHRYESHMRQHTIQIEKTLAALGRYPGEADRLLRLVYAALAEVEAAAIGVPDLEPALHQATAEVIQQRNQEVLAALAG